MTEIEEKSGPRDYIIKDNFAESEKDRETMEFLLSAIFRGDNIFLPPEK